ncbi:MAG: 2-C-methyl-D-erythritol 4-phosphate cytidylyltransferase [Candidatus Neomarinimicrobiota bacterium]
MKISAIIPAAGTGSRFGGEKQLKLLGRRPLLFHTIQPFLALDEISEIVVSVPADHIKQLERELHSFTSSKPIKVVGGGERRQDSVFEGLKAADENSELILIHDAVRPFVSRAVIQEAVEACKFHDAVVVALPAKDTIKQVMGNQIIATLPRNEIWLAQTPQVFMRSVLKEALELAQKQGIEGTDEAVLAERLGYQVGIIKGSPLNIKITTAEDWIFAEAIYADLEK